MPSWLLFTLSIRCTQVLLLLNSLRSIGLLSTSPHPLLQSDFGYLAVTCPQMFEVTAGLTGVCRGILIQRRRTAIHRPSLPTINSFHRRESEFLVLIRDIIHGHSVLARSIDQVVDDAANSRCDEDYTENWVRVSGASSAAEDAPIVQKIPNTTAMTPATAPSAEGPRAGLMLFMTEY